MKNLTSKFLLFGLLFLSFTVFYACSGENTNQNAAEGESAELIADAAYVCPMRCEGSDSDKPGKCPVCGMDLVKADAEQENSQGEGEDPEAHEDEEGHDHGEEGHDHGEEGHDHEH